MEKEACHPAIFKRSALLAYSSDTPMTEYNDAIVRQIVEQIRVQNDNSIDIIFIGGITEKARF